MSFIKRFQKKTAAAPSKSEVMRARPMRNPVLTWGPDAKGDMVINVPLERKPWLSRLGRLVPTPNVRHIILDDIGADVWSMCDGETSIDTIRRKIVEKYQMNNKEAEASLLEHLKQLAQRKLIVAVSGPEDEPTETPDTTPMRFRNRKERRKRK
jgi:hypothetical protein